MSKIRIRPGITVAAASTLVLTACMGGSDGGSSTDDGEAVTLRVSLWTGNEPILEALDEIGAEYAEQNPDVAGVEFESRSPEEYHTALTAQLAGGNPPDVGWVREDFAKQFISAGVLIDVGEELRSDDAYQADDLLGSAMQLWQDGEAIYAYPFSTSPFGIFYNADHFEAAGVPNPEQLIADGEWTWERLAEVGEQIVNSDTTEAGLIVRDFNFSRWIFLAKIWRGFGARAWSEDGTTCLFDSPEMVEAMTFFHDLVFESGVHPSPGTTADFFNGEAAMTTTQIGRANLLEDADFGWGLVPLPAGPEEQARVIGQAGIGVFRASPNQEAAIGLLKHLTNEESSRRLAQWFPPPREALLNADVLGDANPLLSKEQLDSVVVDGIRNGEVLPSHPNAAELADTVRAELDAMWSADADVSSVLSQLCTAIEPELAIGD